MKLYKGSAGKKAWRRRPQTLRNNILWALNLQKDDLFEGRDAKIHAVKSLVTSRRCYKKGWYLLDVALVDEKGVEHSVRCGLAGKLSELRLQAHLEPQKIDTVDLKEFFATIRV